MTSRRQRHIIFHSVVSALYLALSITCFIVAGTAFTYPAHYLRFEFTVLAVLAVVWGLIALGPGLMHIGDALFEDADSSPKN